jgi:hypothetical protein
MRDRLLPEVLVEAIFADEPLAREEADAVIAAAAKDPAVLRLVVDVLIHHFNKTARGLEDVVKALAKNPKVRGSYRSALASYRESRARGARPGVRSALASKTPKPNPEGRQLEAADPRIPSESLGSLVALTVRKPSGMEVRHTFRWPPMLAHNEGGLLILGGRYRIGTHGLVG